MFGKRARLIIYLLPSLVFLAMVVFFLFGLENDPRGKITASREQTVKNPRTLKSLFGFPAVSRAHEPSSATAQQVPSGPDTLPDIIDIMPTEFTCCIPPALS